MITMAIDHSYKKSHGQSRNKSTVEMPLEDHEIKIDWLSIGIFLAFIFCTNKAVEQYALLQSNWWHWIFPSTIYLSLFVLSCKYFNRFFFEIPPLIKGTPNNLSHLAATLRNRIFQQKKILYFLGVSTLISGSVLIFLTIWNGLIPSQPGIQELLDIGFTSLRPLWISISFFWVICFLLVALNPRTKEERRAESAQQKLDERLEQLKSELTQMNLAVAALHVSVDGATVEAQVNEIWLRELDVQLKVKESLVSVEKIILARQRDVGSISKQIKENKEKARQAVTSSISGVGAGFLTYELGGAIKNFTLLKSGNLHPAVEKTDENNQTIVHNELLDLNNKYRQPELVAEATLLTITFIVSMLAAFIGWRKSLSE